MTKIKQRLLVVLAFILCTVTLLAGLFLFTGKNTQKAEAYISDPNPTVTLELKYDGGYFNKDVVNSLYNQLLGGTGKSYNDIENALSSKDYLTGSDLRTNNGNKDIVISMGGMTWTPVFLSHTNDMVEQPILTLMQSCTNPTEVQYTKHVNWESSWTYPAAIYGSSYARAALVGSEYAINGSTLSGVAAGQAAQFPEYKNFINTFDNFITTPNYVDWQQYDVYYGREGQAFASEFYDDDGVSKWVTDYIDCEKYGAWSNDKLWLPSLYEAEVDHDNLWGDLSFMYVKSTNTQEYLKEYFFTRSSTNSEVKPLIYRYSTDLGQQWDDDSVSVDYGECESASLRAAFHLNLKSVEEHTKYFVPNPSQTRPQQTFTYNGAEQSITVNLNSHVYVSSKTDGSDFSDGKTFKAKNVGTYYISVRCNSDAVWEDTGNATDPRYAAQITINPKPITLKIDSPSVTYGDDPAALTVNDTAQSGTSFAEKETIANIPDINSKIKFNNGSSKPTSTTAKGSYNLTADNGVIGNYNVTFVSGKYTVSARTLKVKWTKNANAKNWKAFNGSSSVSEIYYDGAHPAFSTTASSADIDATFAVDTAGLPSSISAEAGRLALKISADCNKKDVDGTMHSTTASFSATQTNYVLDSSTTTIQYKIVARPVTVKIGNLLGTSGSQYGSNQASLSNATIAPDTTGNKFNFIGSDGARSNFTLSCAVTSASVPGYYPITCTFGGSNEQLKKNYEVTFTGEFGSGSYTNNTYSASNGTAGVYQVRNATITANANAEMPQKWTVDNSAGTIIMSYFHDHDGEKRTLEGEWFTTKNSQVVTLKYSETSESGEWSNTISDATELKTYTYWVQVSAQYHDTRVYKVTFNVTSESVTVTFKGDNLAEAQYGAALPQEDALWALVDSVEGLHFENEDLEGQNAITKLKDIIELYLTDGHGALTAAEAVEGSYAIAFRFKGGESSSNYIITLSNQTGKYTVKARELTLDDLDWGHLNDIGFTMEYGDDLAADHAQHHPNPALKGDITKPESAASLSKVLTFEIWHKNGEKVADEHAHDAGQYTVKITGLPDGWDKMYKVPVSGLEKDFNITAKEISLTITKAQSTAYHAQTLAEMTETLNDQMIQYLTAHEGLLDRDYGFIKLTVEYTGEGYETPETCYPNAGKLVIKGEATGTAATNYKINWTNGEWKITQATNTLSGEYKRADWVEKGSPSAENNTLSATFGDGVTLKYYTKFENGEYSELYDGTFNESTPKGKYYVKAYVAGTDNYTEIDQYVGQFEVTDHSAHTWVADETNGWTWTWDGEHNTYTVKLTFKCNAGLEEHTHEETAEVATDDSGAPTCTEEGDIKYTATVTYEGETYTSEKTDHKAAKGHRTDAMIFHPEVAAECTKAGSVQYYECPDCHRYFEESTAETEIFETVVEATGHSWNDGVITKDPTCTTAGEKKVTCTACNEEKTEEVAALGHDWQDESVTVQSDCTHTGLKNQKCSRCGATQNDVEVPALGHSWNAGEVTDEATCTHAGTRTYTCERDGCGVTRTEVVKAAGHNWNAGVEEPQHSCTEPGTITYTCEDCGTTRTETVPAQHTWETDSVIKPATCTENGLENQKCKFCEATREDVVIPALGHQWNDGSVTKAADCTHTGTKTYTCERGECHAEKTEEIPALGHLWDNGTVTKAADCTHTGTKTYTCTRGGDCHETKTEEVLALGHSWTVDEVTQEPDCTHTGLQNRRCTRCNAVEKNAEIPALGHEWVDGAIIKHADCTHAGAKNRVCSRCGYERDGVEIPALGHSWDTGTVIKAATCEDSGTIEFRCTRAGCNESYTDELEATGHSWGNVIVTKAATCEETGLQTATCLICGKEQENIEIPANGHKWEDGEITSAATCESAGSKNRVCTVCGETEEGVEIPALGHSWDEGKVTLAPTCDAAGQRVHTCTRCGEQSEPETIAAAGHHWDNGTVVKSPGCESAGETVYTCTRCGEIERKYPEALGHAVDANAWERTETSHWQRCLRCGEEVNKHAHNYNEGEITTQPTETEAGVKTYTCDDCGMEKTESVAPTGTTSSGGEGGTGEGSGDPGSTGTGEGPLDGGDIGPFVVIIGVEGVMLIVLIAAVAVLKKR